MYIKFPRPSYKELFKKIREVREAVADGRIIILNQDVIACDALEPGYLIEEDLVSVLSGLLDEISPEKSYKKKIKDLDLFAFR